MRQLYTGIDLHSNNNQIGIIDGPTDKRVFKKRLSNNIDDVLKTLEPFKEEIEGIVVESTYNWYWLVDGLMDAGYEVHLANPSAIKQYEGLKYVDDKREAFWLARLLYLGILPEGYIYPIEHRPIRDLLRKRGFLVKHRTAHILSFQGYHQRCCGGEKLSGRRIKALDNSELKEYFDNKHSFMAARASLSTIRFLDRQIEIIEKEVLSKARLADPFKLLLTVPGVGKILGLTIMLEVGDINRFKEVGNFVSYCRCAPSKWKSNEKSKGKGNTKNGNKYLSWAYVEAAHIAKRSYAPIKCYYQRKDAKTNGVVAIKAVASKLSRASYYVMRDRVKFDMAKAFGLEKKTPQNLPSGSLRKPAKSMNQIPFGKKGRTALPRTK